MLKQWLEATKSGTRVRGASSARPCASVARWAAIAAVIMLIALPLPGVAQELVVDRSTDLAEMSLEELMNIEVTSVSKKAEPILHAPSAVFVITQEDIRRSGATSIPDVLRMAPGVHVGRIDANKWAVGVRGFNGSFANKLLVLIDGRSVYTPLFSGVYWDVQDVMLDDVDRIEIIRGPGATLWGANAVNGVINIMTKEARHTEGVRSSLTFGNQDRGTATFRLGRQLNDRASLRVWGKRLAYDDFADSKGTSASDHWNLWHGGFRLDLTTSTASQITIQGEGYDGNTGQTRTYPALQAPYFAVLSQRGDIWGGNFLGRWNSRHSDRLSSTVQFYGDVAYRDDKFVDALLTTFDLDCQQEWSISDQVALVYGAGIRSIWDEIDSTAYVVAVPAKDHLRIYSAFAQSKFDIIKTKLSVTTGSKFEHNSYTGFEYQPSIRALWSPSTRASVWSAVSRAVRTPSRGERMGELWLATIPPLSTGNPSDIVMRMHYGPSPSFGSEILLAKEIGVRMSPRTSFWIDVALFRNTYEGLIMGSLGEAKFVASDPPIINLPFSTVNGHDVKTQGAELTVDWRPKAFLRAQAVYTHIDRFDSQSPDFGTEVTSDRDNFYFPKNQLGLRVLINPRQWCDLDFWARIVGRLENTIVEEYQTLDVRLAVRPVRGVEIALVGNDLLQSDRTEFIHQILAYEIKTPRQFHCTVTWGI